MVNVGEREGILLIVVAFLKGTSLEWVGDNGNE